MIKRKIEEQPKRWHTTLNEALWAYRMSCHGATKVSPYQLVYGHEAVLPWETRLGSRRVTFQDQLTADDYTALMKDELEDLAGHWLTLSSVSKLIKLGCADGMIRKSKPNLLTKETWCGNWSCR